MHVFFESVWKLHIGEIPEKPEHDILKLNTWVAQRNYDLAIAAIKQNALTVGNPEFLESHFWCGKFEHLNLIEIPPPPDKFYFWPGGYETKEIQDIVNWNYPISTITGISVLTRKTVAILTLPEGKKNTMEISEFKCMTCSTAITKGEYDTFGVCDACYDANYKKQTASGSVAAPKEESLQWPSKIELPNHSEKLESENTALREALKDIIKFCEQFELSDDKKQTLKEYKKLINRQL